MEYIWPQFILRPPTDHVSLVYLDQNHWDQPGEGRPSAHDWAPRVGCTMLVAIGPED